MLFVLGALTLMVVDYRNPAAFAFVRTTASIVTYPMLLAVDAPRRLYDKTWGFFSSQTSLTVENTVLKEQIQFFRAQQQNLNVVQQENKRLREMLNAAPRDTYNMALAEIVGAADDRIRGVVTIDKGARDGVYDGQVVLSGEHIYGQVIDVTAINATVMQLVDRGHTIPVSNQRTGAGGLANGTGRGGTLEIKNLPTDSVVNEGDIFVSSGLGGLFPAGFPVAQVIPHGIEFKSGDPFPTVKAAPFVNYEASREVLLLWKKDKDKASVVAPVERAVAVPKAAVAKGASRKKP